MLMNKSLFVLMVFSFLFSWLYGQEGSKNEPVQFSKNYRASSFSDGQRLEKIKGCLPVIDSLFIRYAVENHFPGMAYGLVVDGELVHAGNYGYTALDKKTPVTSSSMFRIASMSKSFAALAIVKLRDEGKLRLDDPAYLYVPELKNIKYPTADAPLITVRHLLTHGAGFPEDNPWGDRQLADSDREFLEFLGKQISFSNPPGITYEYSNLGFALLGKIITNVSGVRYQDYIRKEIWEPLGMANTTYEYGDIAPDKLAHGYRWLNEKWNEEELLHDAPDGSWGAMGSMISSVEEYANYLAMHINAWPPRNDIDNGPVSRSSLREMHHPWRWSNTNLNFKYADGRVCPTTNAYSYGLRWMKDCDGKTFIGHTGGLPGFGSQWNIMPDYGVGIVAFANRTYAPMAYINNFVLDTLVKMADLQPRQLPPSDILEQRKMELTKLLTDWEGAEQSGIFAENFFPDYPIDSLRKESKILFEKAGNIKSVKEMKPLNQLRGSFIIEGSKTDLEVFFTLSPENPPLIQAYRIRDVRKE